MVLKRSPDIGSQDLNNVKLGQGRPVLVSCDYLCYMALPYDAVGWSARCDCGIS